MTTFQFPQSSMMEHLYRDRDFHDVVLIYKQAEFLVHRNIISVFSRYLHQLFTLPSTDRDLYRVDIDDLPVDVDLFRQFLDSLYCQPLSITKKNAFDLYYIAEFFKVEQIKSSTFSFIQNLSPPDLCHVITCADDCFHTTFIKECCPLLDKLSPIEPLVLKEETLWTLSKFLKTNCSIKWLLTSLVKSFIEGSIEVTDLQTVFQNSINLIKEIDLDFIWKEVVQILEKYEEMTRVLLDFCLSLIPINPDLDTSLFANMTSSDDSNTNIRDDFLFWMLVIADRIESNQIDGLAKEIPGFLDLGQRDSAQFRPCTLIKLSGHLKSIDHVMWLIKCLVKSFMNMCSFPPEQVKKILTLLEFKEIPLNFLYSELFVPLKGIESLSLVLIEFSIKYFSVVSGINSNSNYFVETIELADRTDLCFGNLGSYFPKFKVINANPIAIKSKTFKILKEDFGHFETDYWLLQSLVTSYKTLSNHNQSNSDWNVENFADCLYLFEFEPFTFSDLNQILMVSLSEFDELSSVLFKFSVSIMNPKIQNLGLVNQVSFKKVTFKLKNSDYKEMLDLKVRKLFQSKLIDDVIDLSDMEVDWTVLESFINSFAQCNDFSQILSFIKKSTCSDFQKHLLMHFLEHSTKLTVKDYEDLVDLVESINIDCPSLLSSITITSTESINHGDFDRLIDLSIKFNNVSLLNYTVASFDFTFKPKVISIPENLLIGLNQQEFMNQKKVIWLKFVLRKSLKSNSSELVTITAKLFGKSILFEELPNPLIRVCLWSWSGYHNDVTSKIKKAFASNWPYIELTITATHNPESSNINDFDVVFYHGYRNEVKAQLLNQVVDVGKGLVVSSSNSSVSINGDLKYGAFKGLGDGEYYNSGTSLGTFDSNDLITTSVNSFSCQYGTGYSSINPEFKTVASLGNGKPLVLKKEFDSIRVVDLLFDATSTDVNGGTGWKSNTDGHYILANSIVWVSGIGL
ncbi:hypothetical protein P9112_012770 [Eukaryota sp. TZLM1-RC]